MAVIRGGGRREGRELPPAEGYARWGWLRRDCPAALVYARRGQASAGIGTAAFDAGARWVVWSRLAAILRSQVRRARALRAVLTGPTRVRRCCWWPHAAQSRRLTFRCERGRSNGRSGTNDCRRSRPVAGAAHDSGRYSKFNTASARGRRPGCKALYHLPAVGHCGDLGLASAADARPHSRPTCHFRR
jgi:hypothetical protein